MKNETLLAIGCSVVLYHCGSDVPVPPPDSWAQPPAQSCGFIRTESSGYGSAQSSDDTPGCTDVACDKANFPNSESAFSGGGADGYDNTYYHHTTYRIGTCASGTPISCKASTATNACDACLMNYCCIELTVANADANVGWFAKCVSACTDDDCKKRCSEHVKNMPSASIDELHNLTSCMQEECSDACQ